MNVTNVTVVTDVDVHVRWEQSHLILLGRDGSWVSGREFKRNFPTIIFVDHYLQALLHLYVYDRCKCNDTRRVSGAPIWKEKEHVCIVDQDISCTHCLPCLRTNNPPGSSIYWTSTFIIFCCHFLVGGAASETFAGVTLIRSVTSQVKGWNCILCTTKLIDTFSFLSLQPFLSL